MIAIEIGIAEEEAWRAEALCRDGSASLVELFFSEQLDDIARAKAFCRGCEVRVECLEAALDRREPWGVWGGELLANGKVLAQKRKRGRPPKVAPPQFLSPVIRVQDVLAEKQTAQSHGARCTRTTKIAALWAGRGDIQVWVGALSPRRPDLEPRPARGQCGRRMTQ